MNFPVAILLLIAGAVACLLLRDRGIRYTAAAAGAATAAALVFVALDAPAVLARQVLVVSSSWIPAIGLDLAFRLDGLSLVFALLILVVGLLVVLYSRYYLTDDDAHGRFYALLMLFTAAMLGIVLSENLLLLVVFWELTSLTSFLLIGFHSDSAESRRGARMALTVTGGGGLAVLGGVLILGSIGGSYAISDLFAARDVIQQHPHYTTALLLLLFGAFTKSAQFPFHFWLPEAMAAPTPVSAFLHSATMVKAGVFLLARLYPILGNNIVFEYVVATTGLVTLVFAAYVAVFQHDLKGLLAYSTISHLGLITFLLGLDTPLSSVAAIFHIVNHATFKASLFMAAGIINHETGTRDMRLLSGLWQYMPHTATLAMLAAAAMAGVPLFNGFLSKEMFFAEALEIRDLRVLGTIAPIAVTFGGVFSVAYSVRFIHDVFFNGDPRGLSKVPHEPPRYMKLPVEALVILVLAVGILPAYTVAPLLDLAGPVVYGAPLPSYDIALWHGFTAPLAMSAAAIVGGVFMYWLLQQKYALHLHVPAALAARLLFQGAYNGAVTLSARITRWLENGSLQRYLALLVMTLVILGGWPLLEQGYHAGDVPVTPLTPLALVLWLTALAAAIGTVVFHHDRLVAVILAGVVGLAASITFAYFSAPDLALTQLSVEVVTTVVLLMALALLPQSSPLESSRFKKLRDTALAFGAGLGVTALSWAALTRPHQTIAGHLLEASVPQGGGSNVVNVILVDFRGFDTFGEIIVLGTAAIGAWMLMEGVQIGRAAAPPGPARNPLLLASAARLLLPFGLLIAFYMFVRGHNLPGGGFIAGLIASAALLMQYMGIGLAASLERMRLEFGVLIGAGILVAALTGIASMILGFPFLTSAYGHPHLPLLGDIPLASAMAFDLGVFMTVVGSTMLALTMLARARVRSIASTEFA